MAIAVGKEEQQEMLIAEEQLQNLQGHHTLTSD